MARLRQQFLPPGFFGTAKTGLRELTRDDLGRYVADTNAALQDGLPVPFLDKHCPVDGLDNGDSEAYQTRGWLRKLHQNKDGSVSYSADITDADTAKRIKDGSIKFVSPQLNPTFTKNGKDFGSIVRHLAFTPKPVNDKQGMMAISLSEAAKVEPFTVSLQAYQPTLEPVQMADDPKKKNPFDEAADEPTDDTSETPNPENEQADELPTNDTTVVEETPSGVDIPALLMKLVEASGAAVPEGTDLATEAGQAIAIGVMLGKMAASDEPEEETIVEPIESESPNVSQFSDNPEVQQMAERIERLEADKSAQHRKHCLAGLTARIKAKAGYPKQLKKDLIAYTGAVQFAENGADKSKLSISQVMDLIDKNIPPQILQMADAAVEDVDAEEHPDKEFLNDKDNRSGMNQQEAAQMAEDDAPTQFGGEPFGGENTMEVQHTPQPVTQAKRGRPAGSKNKAKK